MNSEVIAPSEGIQTTGKFVKVIQSPLKKHHLENSWMWISSLTARLDRLVEGQQQEQGSYKLRKCISHDIYF